MWQTGRWKTGLRRWRGLVVLVLWVVAVFWLMPVGGITAVLQTISLPMLLWALLAWGLQQYLTALRLRLLATGQAIALTTFQVLAINLTVSFYQLFVPGTVAGVGLRWYWMTQAGGEKGAALTAVALNRLLDGFFGVTLGLAFWLLAQQGNVGLSGVALLGVVGLTAVGWFLFARLAPHLLTWLHGQVARRPQPWARWLLEWVARLLAGVVAFAETAVGDLLLLGLVAAAQFLATILTFVLLAWAVGIQLPLLLLGAIRAALQFTSLIPFAFLGVREAGLLALLTALDVATEKAVALSLLLAAQSVLMALLGGVLELGRNLGGFLRVGEGEFRQDLRD